ncbi:MAG: hypothetical protein HY540_03910 [Deltaproteobacteria bacterium]|nr:hypothetical protein [Deltaproteobacteria bacterium]
MKHQKLLLFVTMLVAGICLSTDAQALSQFARKYNVNCQTCHTAFPRLTYFGEQFKRNAYQMPETQDGDETKDKVNDELFIDKIGNLFGVRVSISPVKYEWNRLTTEGVARERLSFGNPNWLQFFASGNIFKNTSLLIETEIQSNKSSIQAYNNWFMVGYHNIFDSSLLNVRIGKLSALDHAAQSGRLRMIPSLSIDGLANVKSAGGYTAAAQATALAGSGVTAANSTQDDQVAYADAQPGVEVFGYKGPFLYSVGVANGKTLTDANKYKNFFGTLRAEIEKGDFAGSNLTQSGYLGWDTANNTRARQTDKFWRSLTGANLRWKKFDVIGAFLYGKDDNWNLLTNLNQTSKSIMGQAGYMLTTKWFLAMQYDWVKGTDGSNDANFLSPSVTFMPRENMRLDLLGRIDFKGAAADRKHEVGMNIRTMF